MLLDQFITKYSGEESIEELVKYLDNLVAEKDIQKQVYEQEQGDIIFSARKKTFRNVVESIPELQLHLQNGLRMPIIETGQPEELNTVLLTHHKNDVLEKQLLPCVSKKLGLQGKYTIMQAINFGAGIHFCNHCTYEMDPEKYLVFENISADIGAWYRLKNFISRINAMPRDDLYLFVLASNMNDIYKFNEEIYENGTVAERYANPKTHVFFIYFIYQNNEIIQTPFVLDINNETVFL